MKRTTLISAVALIAMFGSATASVAHDGKGERMGKGGQQEHRMGGGKGGQKGGKMGGRGMMADFATLDADGDGKVTQEELDALKAAHFAEIDTDGNGKVSAEEFAANFEAQKSDRKAKRVEKMIERLDADKDGEVSAEEMTAMMKTSPIERLDANKDGVLTEDELTSHGKRGWGKNKAPAAKAAPAQEAPAKSE